MFWPTTRNAILTLLPVWVPALCGVALLSGMVQASGLDSWIEMVPTVALGFAAGLAVRFHQHRAGWATLALFGFLVGTGTGHVEESQAAVFLVLLPVFMMLVAALPPAPVVSWRGALAVGALGFTIVGVDRHAPELLARLHAWDAWMTSKAEFLGQVSLSPSALVSVVIASGVLIGLAIHRREVNEAALAATPTWVAATLIYAGESDAVRVLWSALAITWAMSVVETSHRQAYRDRLTALRGRRALEEYMAHQPSRFSVAMVDVDHFKKFNDRYGHDAGDEVLRAVAARLDAVGGGGRAFRYGGEEFTIVFPRKDAERVVSTLDAVRDRIKKTKVSLPRKASKKGPGRERKVSVTVSIGVAERTREAPHPTQIVKLADEALYKAKKGGRNQVVKAKQ